MFILVALRAKRLAVLNIKPEFRMMLPRPDVVGMDSAASPTPHAFMPVTLSHRSAPRL